MPRGWPQFGGAGGGGGGTPVLPSFIGYSAVAGNTTVSVSLTLSAGTVDVGDLMLVGFVNNANVGTVAAGWSPISIQQITQANGTATHCTWCYRFADALEPASYGFGGSLTAAVLLNFRGAGQISSLPVITDHGATSTTPSIPAITTRLANQIVVACMAQANAGFTAPGTYTQVSQQALVGGTNFGLWVGYLGVVTAGVVASVAGAYSPAGNWGAMAFAIGQ